MEMIIYVLFVVVAIQYLTWQSSIVFGLAAFVAGTTLWTLVRAKEIPVWRKVSASLVVLVIISVAIIQIIGSLDLRG